MLASSRSGLASFTRPRLPAVARGGNAIRHKSEFTRRIDDFPYRSLSYHDASHMSAEMESTTKLPLRSFFAQHRPLMPFGHPVTQQEVAGEDKRWVHVPVNNGRFPIFMNDDRPMWQVLPEDIAKKMGPFNRDVVMSTKWNEFKHSNRMPSSLPSSSATTANGAPLSPMQLQSILSDRFPILMEHLQKMTGGEGELRVIPLTVERVISDDTHPESLEATSVRRKRKLKMNRHKYRKRLKEQRTKRRRLGK